MVDQSSGRPEGIMRLNARWAAPARVTGWGEEMHRIRITAGRVTATALLNDSKTAEAISEALPIRGEGLRWGDEIYFSIPADLDKEDARAVVGLGDLGYWAPGTALCIFFGPTPVSRGAEIRPASPDNVFGRLEGDPKAFATVSDGSAVMVERHAEGAKP
jgi:uncharacterized protein